MASLTVKSAANYYQTPGARELAHEVKDGVEEAIEQMASEMAGLLPDNAVLVPIPGRNGYATSSLKLAQSLESMTDAKVDDILVGENRDSLYSLKKQDRSVDESFFGYQLKSDPKQGNIVLIDGVSDSGATGIAAAKAFNAEVQLITHSSHFSDGVGTLDLEQGTRRSVQRDQLPTLGI